MGPDVKPLLINPMPEIQVRHSRRRDTVVLHADRHGIEFERNAEALDDPLQSVRLHVLQHQMCIAPAPAQLLRLFVFNDRNAPGAHLLQVVVQGGGRGNRCDHLVRLGPLAQHLRDRACRPFRIL